VQCLPALPGFFALVLIAGSGGVACVVWVRCRGDSVRIFCSLLLGLSSGTLNACVQAHVRVNDALSDLHQDQVSRLILRVAELPDGDDRHQRFVGELAEPPRAGIPSRVQVTWQTPPGASSGMPAVVPGQVWRMAVVLRRPHGVLNPAGPDAEARMFARGLRAVGTVRGQPRLVDDQPWASAGIAIERARHHVRAGLRKALGDHRYAPVLIALAIGDQAGVARVADQNSSEPICSGRSLIPKENAESRHFPVNTSFVNRRRLQNLRLKQFEPEVGRWSRQVCSEVARQTSLS